MPETAETVAAVRRFTRFYTRAVGVLDRAYLGGPYTVTESRVLYEIAHGGGLTPKAIGGTLGLDPGYLSRMVAKFERDGLVGRRRAPDDGRSIVLTLTDQGRAYFASMDARSAALVERLVGGLSDDGQERLTGALGEAQALLARTPKDEVTLRRHGTGDIGWVTQAHGEIYRREYGWDHRFEAMVARITADLVERFDPDWEESWIAERGGARVGCIFLERQDETTAKLRLLLVDPRARGLGLGRRLVDACVGRARELGYREMTLWTQSVLTSARAIYQAAGFELQESWPNRDFGGLGLTSERWRLVL